MGSEHYTYILLTVEYVFDNDDMRVKQIHMNI